MNVLIRPLTLLFLLVLSLGELQSAIVYTDINPDVTTTLSPNPGFQFGVVAIDFDGDGTGEYNFRWDMWGPNDWFMHMTFANFTNEFVLKGTATNPFGGRYIQALNTGTPINSTSNWGNSGPEPFIGDNSDPNFQGLGDQYVGVKFDLNGNTHYGWVLVSFDNALTLTVKEYAYEDVANTPINAGDTASGTNPVILVTSISVQGLGGASNISTQGGTLQMKATVLPHNVTDSTVVWSVSNGAGTASIVDSTGHLTALSNGTVTIVARANDNSGISDSVQITISNQNVGLAEFEANRISVFPNPSNHFIEVESNGLNISEAKIYSENGQLVLKHEFPENSKTIDVSLLEGGAYFLVLISKNGKVDGIKRWIKY